MSRLLFVLLLLYHTQLLAQPASILDKSYSDKLQFTDSLEQALKLEKGYTSPEQIKKLHALTEWAAQKGDKELKGLLQLLEFKVQMAKHGVKDTVALEKGLLELQAAYRDETGYAHIDIIQSIGLFYLDIRHKNSLSFEYFLMAYEKYEDLSEKDFPNKKYYTYLLAGAYFRYEDFNNAIKYFQEVVIDKEQDSKNITVFNTIGICHREMRNYDSAMYYFNHAYELAMKENDAVWTGILSGNVGELYYLQKRNAEAIPLLEECVTSCISNNVRKNAAAAICRLTGIYLSMNDLVSAERTLNKIATIHEGTPYWPTYQVAERRYHVTAQFYSAKGNSSLAYLYADSALMAKDSAYAEQIESNKEKAEERADYVQRKLELSEMTAEKDRQFFIRNSLIICIVLGTVIGLLFINRQRLQRKKLVAELDAVTNKLINLSPGNQEQPEPKTEPLPVKEEEEEIDPETLSKLENATLLTNEQWDEFRKLFDKVHKGFLNNLRRKIPDLSPADIRFIALTKLRLTSKEMALMLGVSPATIRIYKFRLRKKLGLDKEDDIENFINKM